MIAQALYGSKVALLCLTQYVFIVFIFIYVCVYVSSASLPCRSTHASLHILFADGKSGVLLRRESLGRTNPWTPGGDNMEYGIFKPRGVISPYQCTSHNSHNISLRYPILSIIIPYIPGIPWIILDQDDFTPVLHRTPPDSTTVGPPRRDLRPSACPCNRWPQVKPKETEGNCL